MNQNQQIDIDSSSQDETKTGQQFLQVFNLLINTARMHHDNNQAVIQSIEQFIAVLEKLTRESGEITLLFTEGGFYLEEEKIVCDKHSAPFEKIMRSYFEERELEGLRFYEPILNAPFSEISGFARLMSQASVHEDPSDWLEKQLEQENITWIELISVSPVSVDMHRQAVSEKTASQMVEAEEKDQEGAPHDASAGVRAKKRKNALQTYGYAVMSLKDIAQKIGANKKASIKKTMRLAQNMIDMVVEDNQIFLSLSTIRDHDDYTFTHSINVAILSISLGYKIGLPKSMLETLSLSAIFHDLGKIDIPHSILNKPDKLTETEFNTIKQHSLNSVRRIIKLQTSRKKKISILLPPFEHHLKYDLSGYPKTPRKKPISLLGRIIAIADVFDAITAPRIYRPTAISPDRALGYMQEKAGRDFDPLLLKVFINMIGVYPIGTLLKFEDDELGLVAEYVEEEDRGKELWVQMLKKTGQNTFKKGEKINLGILDPKTGTFNRTILESIHPADYGIQPAEYIM